MSIFSSLSSLFRPNEDTKLSASNSPSSLKIGGDQNTQGFVDWVERLGTMSDIDYGLETDELLESMGVDASNSFLGSLGSFFKKLVTAWDDYTGNTANRENIAYQKEYNQQVFNRADTQFQRTVADLRAAGLSSQLAAGAPSTVAGSSSAPQRTVGNESEALSKLIGMVTSLKQTNANAELASAQADKARSEAAINSAQLPWVNKLNDAQYMTSMANHDYTMALTRVKMLEGDNYTEKVQSEIRKNFSDINKNNSLIELYGKQASLYEAQEGKTQAERKRILQQIENDKQELKNMQQDFQNKVLQGLQIKASTSLTEKQTEKAVIDAATSYWNLQLSQEFGLRTSDAQTRVSVFGNSVDNIQSLFEWNKEMTPLYWITSGNYPWKK